MSSSHVLLSGVKKIANGDLIVSMRGRRLLAY